MQEESLCISDDAEGGTEDCIQIFAFSALGRIQKEKTSLIPAEWQEDGPDTLLQEKSLNFHIIAFAYMWQLECFYQNHT